MRIVIIGGTGTIGSAVAEALSPRHDIVTVGRTSGDHQADIASPESIVSLFKAVGPFDALVSAAGQARFKPLGDLGEEDFQFSLGHKLMGQINLVLEGLHFIRDGGSFTLTSGVLAREPSPGSAAVSMVNSGIEGFSRAAALEMPRGVRINVVSPPWVAETLRAMGRDESTGLPAATVAKAYAESVEGAQTGQVIDAREFA